LAATKGCRVDREEAIFLRPADTRNTCVTSPFLQIDIVASSAGELARWPGHVGDRAGGRARRRQARCCKVAQTLEKLPAGIEPARKATLHTDLEKRLTPGADPIASREGRETWQGCAANTAKFTGDLDHEETAVSLGVLACEAGPGSPYLARAIQADWIERLNERAERCWLRRCSVQRKVPAPARPASIMT
jgi:hypothetical protein